MLEPAMEPAVESPKRLMFSFPFFRRNRNKDAPPQNAEVAERKILVEEGHRYLAEATDLIHQNRDHLYRKDPGLQQMLGDRWAELYGSAPSGKKLTKGRLIPEEFRDKSQALLADVQAEFEALKIDDESAGSSSQPHNEPPPEEPSSLKRGQSVRREPSRRKRELRDDGPVRPRDVQFGTNPEPHPQEVIDSSISSRKGLTHRTRDDKDDRYAPQVEEKRRDPGPRLDDRKPSEQSRHSTSERTRYRDERERRRDDRDDRYRDDRQRDGRYRDKYRREDTDRDKDRREDRDRDKDRREYRDRDKDRREDRNRPRDRDDRYYEDRYYRDDRYRDDRYYRDRYRDDYRRNDRYYDDRRSYDLRRDDRYDPSHDDRSRGYREDRYGGDRRREVRQREDRRGEDRRREEDRYRDDRRRKEGRREGDDRRRDRRKEDDDHDLERHSSSRRHGEENSQKMPIPVSMSPTYIGYPNDDEKLHRRNTGRHQEGDHSGDNRPETPVRSQNPSPSPKAEEFVTDPETLSPDPDLKRISHHSMEELPE